MKGRAPTLLELIAILSTFAMIILVFIEVMVGWEELVGVTIIVPMISIPLAFGARFLRVLRWHITGEQALVEHIYKFVDGQLGAGRYEAQRAAKIMKWINRLSGNWKASYASHRSTNIQQARIRHYVQIQFKRKRRLMRRWHKWDLGPVTLHWTSERQGHTQSDTFWEKLEYDLADALGIDWSEGIFARVVDRSNDTVTFTVRTGIQVPDRLEAGDGEEEEIEDDEEDTTEREMIE